MRPISQIVTRFWPKVKLVEDCWVWTGYTGQLGYGRTTYRNTVYMAHRWSYEQVFGFIPEGLTLDHLCRNRACVNPFHLEPVTRAENVMRGVGLGPTNAAKVVCVRGHPLTLGHYYTKYKNSKPWRQCKVCNTIQCRAYNQRKRK